MTIASLPAVLVIAGSDSSGGAGLQRDLRVLGEFGVRAVTAITAVTAQSDKDVKALLVLPPDLIGGQISAALDTCRVGAVKIGMLGDAATVVVVADCLARMPGVPIVLDPVLQSTSGTVLLDSAGQQMMLSRLLPMVTLLTPNLLELAQLFGDRSERILDRGPQAILLKGGHGEGAQSIDLLLEAGREPVELASPRLPVAMRGTGCALSTAIAVELAKGNSLEKSCRVAKDYVWTLLRGCEVG